MYFYLGFVTFRMNDNGHNLNINTISSGNNITMFTEHNYAKNMDNHLSNEIPSTNSDVELQDKATAKGDFWQVPFKKRNAAGNTNNQDLNSKKSKKDDSSSHVLKLQNRFDVFTQPNSTEVMEPEVLPATVKEPKTPPIFVPNVSSVKAMEQTLESVITRDEYLYKCINNNTVKLSLSSSEAYRKVVRKLNELQINFHTYQLKQERTYRVVLKNMHFSTDLEDIKSSLSQLGHSVRNITNARNFKTKQPLPMFYIDLEPNNNNKDIFSLQYLLNAKVVFEPPYKKRDIVQCKRCQQYGHTRTYCRHPFRCVKCGKNHDSLTCPKDSTTPPTCALCEGDHPANYKGCTVYKSLQKKGFPPLRAKQTAVDVDSSRPSDTAVNRRVSTSTGTNNVTTFSNYAEAVKSNCNKNDEDISLSQTIQEFFIKFEKMFCQQSQQIGSLLTLLTTLVSKLK